MKEVHRCSAAPSCVKSFLSADSPKGASMPSARRPREVPSSSTDKLSLYELRCPTPELL